MTHSQKLEQERYFKMVLKFTIENGIYIWPDANASYKVVNGKFVPDNKRSRNAMMETTTKQFHSEFICK